MHLLGGFSGGGGRKRPGHRLISIQPSGLIGGKRRCHAANGPPNFGRKDVLYGTFKISTERKRNFRTVHYGPRL
jgi:hypothetical protein